MKLAIGLKQPKINYVCTCLQYTNSENLNEKKDAHFEESEVLNTKPKTLFPRKKIKTQNFVGLMLLEGQKILNRPYPLDAPCLYLMWTI